MNTLPDYHQRKVMPDLPDLRSNLAAVHARCYHPKGKWNKLRWEDIEQSVAASLEEVNKSVTDVVLEGQYSLAGIVH